MLMLLDKVGVPEGHIISTTGEVLNKIYNTGDDNKIRRVKVSESYLGSQFSMF